jgi:hypothetical protein
MSLLMSFLVSGVVEMDGNCGRGVLRREEEV